MAIKINILGSGSKGNSVLVDNGRNKLLIDCGITMPVMTKKLREVGLSLCDLDGILITHEHEDHVRALPFISQEVPIYAHENTMDFISQRHYIPIKHRMSFDSLDFSIGSFDITGFRVSHDAVYPLGYSISDCDGKVTYATDMGYYSNEFLRLAKGSNIVVIESNHDVDMLMKGRYPAFLKRRIIGEKGHLSNKACAEAVANLAESGTGRFVLAHLSEENNVPELAYWTNKEELKKLGATDGDVKLSVADQHRASGWLE